MILKLQQKIIKSFCSPLQTVSSENFFESYFLFSFSREKRLNKKILTQDEVNY